MTTKAAVWLRVSTTDQDTENQVAAIEQLVQHRGFTVADANRYRVEASAWNGGKPNGEYKAALDGMLDAAHRGEFSVLVVWALDRLTRGGAEDTLRLLRQLRERGCTVLSVQEPWLSGSPEVTDVLVSFAGWVAQQESKRRSERIKAGLAKRKAKNLPVGRQPGAKDKKKRTTGGYVAEQERRRNAS
ncbi:recombinase family protein [Sinomonas albida]|uniref:recombinase family protein n=1 Tax=Sinomonas albida TaxID=369942 RepID=UPI003018BF47